MATDPFSSDALDRKDSLGASSTFRGYPHRALPHTEHQILDIPWTQQRLVAWQPIWDPPATTACLAFLGSLMIPVGAVLLVTSDEVRSKMITYSDNEAIRDCHWNDPSNFHCMLNPCTPAAVNSFEPSGRPCCDHSQTAVASSACRSTSVCGMVASLGPACPRNFSYHAGSDLSTAALDAMSDCDPHCQVTIPFELDEDFKPPIVLYYHLTHFWQNHRLYSESRDQDQLAGREPITDEEVLQYVRPLRRPGERLNDTYCRLEWDVDSCSDLPLQDCPRNEYDANGLCSDPRDMELEDVIYAPSGLAAWSMFNDTFQLWRYNANGARSLVCDTAAFDASGRPTGREWGTAPPSAAFNTSNAGCSKDSIAWVADREYKFKRPSGDAPGVFNTLTADGIRDMVRECRDPTANRCALRLGTDIGEPASHYSALPYLYHGWYLGEPYHKLPVQSDEDLMVWMRVAALHSFRKTLRFVNTPMPAGRYELVIRSRFDVTSFKGEKSFIISTQGRVGGGASFVGILYLIFGSLCLSLAILFIVKWLFDRDARQKVLDEWRAVAAYRAERMRSHVIAFQWQDMDTGKLSRVFDIEGIADEARLRRKVRQMGAELGDRSLFASTELGEKRIDPGGDTLRQQLGHLIPQKGNRVVWVHAGPLPDTQ